MSAQTLARNSTPADSRQARSPAHDGDAPGATHSCTVLRPLPFASPGTRSGPAPPAFWLGPALAAALSLVLLATGFGLSSGSLDASASSCLAIAGLGGLAAAVWLALRLDRAVRAGMLPDRAGPCAEGRRLRAAGGGHIRGEAEPDRDHLTGLGGCSWFRGAGEAALAAARRDGRHMALILVDLDHFSDINAFHGCRVGDEALRQVARRLSGAVCGRCVTVRLAGDRFALLQADLHDEVAADAWAKGLLERVGRPLLIESTGLELSASIGIGMFPDHGTTLEPLLRSAEMALSEVKRAGGGRVRVYCKRIDASLRARKTLERDLRQAIDNGDFLLHYQPQIDLRSGRIGGVEALLRWPHRTQGMVPPATFIPLAESCGLIRPLGAWVMGEACRAGRRWHDMGLPIEIAVNLSAAQLRNQELAALVGRTLAESALPPEALELELTESLFVDPSEIHLRRALERVAEMGVQLAIDDFGTGYSSLAYLKRLPFNKIKIDRSFLVDIGNERVDEAIVRAIIGLAKTFGKLVLAEGVETEGQRQFLLREGCDAAQGYLFSRPVPEEAVTALLSADAPRRGPARGPIAQAS